MNDDTTKPEGWEPVETTQARSNATNQQGAAGSAQRVGFCQDCGQALTQETLRAVGTGVFLRALPDGPGGQQHTLLQAIRLFPLMPLRHHRKALFRESLVRSLQRFWALFPALALCITASLPRELCTW